VPLAPNPPIVDVHLQQSVQVFSVRRYLIGHDAHYRLQTGIPTVESILYSKTLRIRIGLYRPETLISKPARSTDMGSQTLTTLRILPLISMGAMA